MPLLSKSFHEAWDSPANFVVASGLDHQFDHISELVVVTCLQKMDEVIHVVKIQWFSPLRLSAWLEPAQLFFANLLHENRVVAFGCHARVGRLQVFCTSSKSLKV